MCKWELMETPGGSVVQVDQVTVVAKGRDDWGAESHTHPVSSRFLSDSCQL